MFRYRCACFCNVRPFASDDVCVLAEMCDTTQEKLPGAPPPLEVPPFMYGKHPRSPSLGGACYGSRAARTQTVSDLYWSPAAAGRPALHLVLHPGVAQTPFPNMCI